MISVYEFENYRKFLTKKISEMPKKGYGQLSSIAREIGVHTTLMSQILKGHKELTIDQAAAVSGFLGLNNLETDYFVGLVQLERAGNLSAKKLYQRQLKELKEQASKISARVKTEARLSEEQKAVFYSDWIYSAVRQTVAILKNAEAASVGEYLGLTTRKTQRAIDFLIQAGLCKVNNGKLEIGAASTHLDSDSPWIKVLHNNWRQKAMLSLDNGAKIDLHYTAPMTLSQKDAEIVREKIIQFIEEVNSVVDPSPSEELVCLNVDWFRVGKT